MKKIFRLFAVLAVSLTALVACEESSTPEKIDPPTPPVEEQDFTLELLNLTKSSVDFKVTPADEEMTYVALIAPKEDFDAFESDDAVISDDLLWFYGVAESKAMTLEAYLFTILKKGVLEASEEALQPDTEYYLYVYGLNVYGEVLTPMEKAAFRTEKLAMTETTFAIELNEISFNSVSVKVTPSDSKALYFVNVFSEERYQEFGGNEQAFFDQLAYVRDYYLGYGATVEQIIANLSLAGERELVFDELLPNTKHYAYVIGVDRDFFANTAVTVEEFITLSAEEVDLTFDIRIDEVTYEGATGVITPSNDTDTYICSVQLAESLEWYESEEEFINSILLDLDYWYGGVDASLRTGVSELKYTGLFPETEYIVVCFGWDQAPTTGLTTYNFTTEAAGGNPDEFTATFTVQNITHKSADVTIIPSNGCHFFFDWCEVELFNQTAEELGSADAAAAYFIDEEIEFGAEWFDGDRVAYLTDMGAMLGTNIYPVSDLQPNTEYVLMVMPLDMTTGEIASDKAAFSEPFRTLDKKESNALVTFEFGHIYDGSELAELDPENFLMCTGYAVMPYKVVANESAANWYTGFYDSDFSEWITSDEEIYDELITYGYDWGSDQVSLNRTEGMAVLTWDMVFTFLGIAEDADGNFGRGTMETVMATKDQVAPAGELLDDFTGTTPSARKSISKKTPMARTTRLPHGMKSATR